MPQASQRGRNQEVLQPVGVILHAVEVVTGSHPRRLVPPQARPIRVTVPLQRHGPYGEARAVGGAVPRAPGVEPPVLGVEPPIDGMGGAVGLRTIRGRSAVGPTATPLHPPRGHQPAAGQRRPHAAGAATTAVWSPPGRLARPCRVPGGATGPHRAFSSSGPRGESTAPLCSWERVAATPDVSLPSRRCRPSAPGSLARAPWLPWHTRHRPAPRFPYRRPRPRSPSGNRPRRPWSGQSPAVSLPRSAAPRPPGRGAPCAGLARWCPAATGGRRPARPATSTGHRGQRRRPGRQTAPPLPPGEGCFDRLGARHHGGHDTRGAQGKDGPRCEPCDPAHAQRLCDRHVAVVQGKTLVHLVRTQCRVLAPPLGQRLPRLCRVVDIRALRHCTRTRQTARRIAHGWSACASCCAG